MVAVVVVGVGVTDDQGELFAVVKKSRYRPFAPLNAAEENAQRIRSTAKA